MSVSLRIARWSLLPAMVMVWISQGQGVCAAEVRIFRDALGQFAIRLPVQWHMEENDDGKVLQMFVSRERIDAPRDRFQVGVTCTQIRRFSKSYPQQKLRSEEDIVELWSNAALGLPPEVPNDIIRMDRHSVGSKRGIICEREFALPGGFPVVHEIRLILAARDNLFEVILEAPQGEFEEYRAIFEGAVETIQIE